MPCKATASPTNSSRGPRTLSKPCLAPAFLSSLLRIPRARSRFPAKPAPKKAPDFKFPSSRRASSPHTLLPQLFLDSSPPSGILNLVENHVWSAGACSRFSFFGPAFSALAGPQQPEVACFRINDLQNAFLQVLCFDIHANLCR